VDVPHHALVGLERTECGRQVWSLSLKLIEGANVDLLVVSSLVAASGEPLLFSM
jgi:hypothetical protein